MEFSSIWNRISCLILHFPFWCNGSVWWRQDIEHFYHPTLVSQRSNVSSTFTILKLLRLTYNL